MSYRTHVWPGIRGVAQRLFTDWLAICIGNDIISWRPLSAGELAHEVTHAAQWDRYGLLYPLRYALSSLGAAAAGRHWYWDNAFEVDARAGMPPI